MSDLDRHQQRADDMGDAMRRYLVAVNLGGIGVLAVLVEKGAGADLPHSIWVPLLLFCFGLTLSGVSIALQKHKALRRRDAARDEESEPDFTIPRWRNQTYDLISFGAFIFGVVTFFGFRLAC